MADNPINDYHVVTSRRGQHPERWSWEIHRKSTPLGIKMTGDGYQSDAAAQFAGKQALAGVGVQPSRYPYIGRLLDIAEGRDSKCLKILALPSGIEPLSPP
jgi:hypothetical protein